MECFLIHRSGRARIALSFRIVGGNHRCKFHYHVRPLNEILAAVSALVVESISTDFLSGIASFQGSATWKLPGSSERQQTWIFRRKMDYRLENRILLSMLRGVTSAYVQGRCERNVSISFTPMLLTNPQLYNPILQSEEQCVLSFRSYRVTSKLKLPRGVVLRNIRIGQIYFVEREN